MYVFVICCWSSRRWYGKQRQKCYMIRRAIFRFLFRWAPRGFATYSKHVKFHFTSMFHNWPRRRNHCSEFSLTSVWWKSFLCFLEQASIYLLAFNSYSRIFTHPESPYLLLELKKYVLYLVSNQNSVLTSRWRFKLCFSLSLQYHISTMITTVMKILTTTPPKMIVHILSQSFL